MADTFAHAMLEVTINRWILKIRRRLWRHVEAKKVVDSEQVWRANVLQADQSGELSDLLDFLSRYGTGNDEGYRD
jgi:hypothetical protein